MAKTIPYLPITIDGRRQCERAANHIGVHPGILSWGLQTLWEDIWRAHFSEGRRGADVVTELALLATLNLGEKSGRAAEALEAFGFIERVGEHSWRIRGAAKWLFALEARSRGGQAAKGNLVPGGKRRRSRARAEDEGPDSSAQPTAQPIGSAEGQPIGSGSALTPSTQHPAPKQKETLGPKKPDPVGPDPRHAPMRDRLRVIFREERGADYPSWGATEGGQLKTLLGRVKDDTALADAWRRGLRSGFPTVSTIGEFLHCLPHFVGTGPPGPTGKVLDLPKMNRLKPGEDPYAEGGN